MGFNIPPRRTPPAPVPFTMDALHEELDGRYSNPAGLNLKLDKAEAETLYATDLTLSIDAFKGVNAVKWDGATDDTAKLDALAALAVSKKLPLRLPPFTGMVTTWKPPSNLWLIGAGSGQTVIKQHPSATGANAPTIDISGTTGVRLQGLTIDGNEDAFTAVSSEWKHCINARGTTDARFTDVVATNAKGDGLYIGLGTTGQHSSNFSAHRLRCVGNMRNGLSIIDLSDGRFVDCEFNNQSGLWPQAGVDIEPNDNTSIIADIHFINPVMTGNTGDGLDIVMYPGGQTQERVKFVTPTIRNNGRYGVQFYGSMGVELISPDISENAWDGAFFASGAITGTTIQGGRIVKNGHHGINCQPVAGSTVKNTKILGTTIQDNGTAAPNTYYGMLWDQVGTTFGSVDGLMIRNVTSGNRLTSNQKYGAYYSLAVTNLFEEGNDFRNNATTAVIHNDDAATRQRGVSLGPSQGAGVASSQTLSSSIRNAIVTTTTTAITLTLPTAPEPLVDYNVWDDTGNAAANNITIAPSAGHTIVNATAPLKITTNYGFVRLMFRSNKWYVVSTK